MTNRNTSILSEVGFTDIDSKVVDTSVSSKESTTEGNDQEYRLRIGHEFELAEYFIFYLCCRFE